jgi:hypothetical protein
LASRAGRIAYGAGLPWLFALGGSMGKLLAIAAAVTAELSAPPNPKWPPNNLNKVLGADYHFNENTLALLLTGVSERLKGGSPVYIFSFERDFVKANLASSVGLLIGNIERKTTAAATLVA